MAKSKKAVEVAPEQVPMLDIAVAIEQLDVNSYVDIPRMNEHALARETECTALIITDAETEAQAVDIRSAIAKEIKEAEAFREQKKQPFLNMGRAIDAAFKTPKEKLQAASDNLKVKLIEYNRKKEEKRLAEEEERRQEYLREVAAKAAEAAFDGPATVQEPVAPPPAMSLPTNMVKTASGSASISKKVWKFEVVSAIEVPRELCIVDEPAVRRRMNEMVKRGQVPSVSGVKFWQEDDLAARG